MPVIFGSFYFKTLITVESLSVFNEAGHKLTLDNFRVVKEGAVANNIAPKTFATPKPHQPSNTDIVVDIKDLKIQYGDTIVLEDFNWTVNRGDRWALVGANGSGKTTLFSVIFADHPLAYSQQVYLFGKRRGTGESIWQIKERINYMGPELISYLDTSSLQTARDFIGSNADKLIEFFRIEEFIDKPLKHLSSGQLQLTLLMRCFKNEKELLLLDEPFQFLDPEVRDKVSDYLQQYLSNDTTLILITHYEEDLARWTEKTMRV